MKEQNVILVDKNDNQIGLMPKMEAHSKGLLHRAFSVFILNGKNELMLQKRAVNKYHSPGLWTNTCCSHPNEGESILSAGRRRLKEEMGIYTELNEVFHFIYKAPFDNGLIEYELDDETDQKFGAGVLYNINKRSAVSFEMSSSKIFDASMKIGYQLNF